MGGSLVPHGGQNPLEPARLNNFIIHGRYINNFKEVYKYLNKLKVTSIITKFKNQENLILNKLNKKTSNLITKKIYSVGNYILKNNLLEIYKYIK
jgi:3-deoxy-D-manno-octulosonic-acid transferase